MQIESYPYRFPLAGALRPERTALMVIDMQVDFVGPGGYMDRLGVDLAPLRAPIGPIRGMLDAMRARGFHVVHTRETFSPDLSDAQPHRLYRGEDGAGIAVGDDGPLGRCLVHGEPCWELIEELRPEEGEPVFDKCAYGAFGCTDIDAWLRERGIEALVLCGVTSNCCIQSNLREALDRGYDCLVVEDACASSTASGHEHSMALIRNPSGVFGAITDSTAVLAALEATG